MPVKVRLGAPTTFGLRPRQYRVSGVEGHAKDAKRFETRNVW